MQNKKLISLELSEDLIKQVKSYASLNDISMSDAIRFAIKEFLKNHEEK